MTVLPSEDVWVSAIRGEESLDVVVAAVVCGVVGVHSIVVVEVAEHGSRPAVH